MEKLLLGTFLTGNKLNVVYKKHVDITIQLLKFIHTLATNGVNVIVGKFFTCDIQNFRIRRILSEFVSHCMHEMSFAEPNPTINKKWIVLSPRVFCNCDAGRVS